MFPNFRSQNIFKRDEILSHPDSKQLFERICGALASSSEASEEVHVKNGGTLHKARGNANHVDRIRTPGGESLIYGQLLTARIFPSVRLGYEAHFGKSSQFVFFSLEKIAFQSLAPRGSTVISREFASVELTSCKEPAGLSFIAQYK